MSADQKYASAWPLAVCALFAQLAIARSGNVVPVMLWSGESSSALVNPLHKTSRPEFEGILAEKLGKGQPPIIVFVKDNFCTEDIKHHKESLQQLNNAGSLTYLTSVESALSVFENLPSYNVTMEDDLESVVEGQLALVQITDLNAIPEIYNMVRESSPNPIVALTGLSCGYTSFERVKRAISDNDNTNSSIIYNTGKILFYLDKSPVLKINEKSYQLGLPLTIEEGKNYTLLMTFPEIPQGPSKVHLNFTFTYKNQYYKLNGIEYYETEDSKILLKSAHDIYFPFDVSYHCGGESIFRYKNKETKEDISVKLTNLQVQMNVKSFGEVYDCVGFMSVPIWTGIFVTAILAIIMIWGITMIMDIRTMDRFDDPKGKTITISAQE